MYYFTHHKIWLNVTYQSLMCPMKTTSMIKHQRKEEHYVFFAIAQPNGDIFSAICHTEICFNCQVIQMVCILYDTKLWRKKTLAKWLIAKIGR